VSGQVFVLTYEMTDNPSEIIAASYDRAALVSLATEKFRRDASALLTDPAFELGDWEEVRITEVDLIQ